MTQSNGQETPTSGDLCFVVGPIGAPDTETRKHADQLFKHVIEPAAKAAGLERVERADRIEGSGNITSEIVARLSEAKIVVADLSEANPNAYYELAIRHVLRLPFAHVIREGESLPFDLAGNRAIRFDLHDLDSAARAKNDLQRTIAAELSKSLGDIETPFTVALDLQALQQQQDAEGNPELAELARVVSRIESTQRDLLTEFRAAQRSAQDGAIVRPSSPLPWLVHRPIAVGDPERASEAGSISDALRRVLETDPSEPLQRFYEAELERRLKATETEEEDDSE